MLFCLFCEVFCKFTILPSANLRFFSICISNGGGVFFFFFLNHRKNESPYQHIFLIIISLQVFTSPSLIFAYILRFFMVGFFLSKYLSKWLKQFLFSFILFIFFSLF